MSGCPSSTVDETSVGSPLSPIPQPGAPSPSGGCEGGGQGMTQAPCLEAKGRPARLRSLQYFYQWTKLLSLEGKILPSSVLREPFNGLRLLKLPLFFCRTKPNSAASPQPLIIALGSVSINSHSPPPVSPPFSPLHVVMMFEMHCNLLSGVGGGQHNAILKKKCVFFLDQIC